MSNRTGTLRNIHVSLWICLLLAPGTSHSAAETSPAQAAVRRDWYFRESLNAIRDWERLLAAWEARTPKKEQVPPFPLPTDGRSVAWPNPVPDLLWADGAPVPGLRLRLDQGKVVVDRVESGQSKTQTVPTGSTVVGGRHPGGGGKDQWYHDYRRRFEAMLAFRPQAAAFSLELAGPADFTRGRNELTLRLRPAGSQAVRAEVALRLLSPAEGDGRDLGKQSLDLPAGQDRTVRFPFELDRPGGAMLIVTVRTGDQSCWMPLLTCVEDVQAVLTGVGQILADQPDQPAQAELASLAREAAGWTASSATPWRLLFERAAALRDRLLLGRIPFQTLLFLKRQPFYSEQPFMDAHHLYNRPGGGIYRLSPVRPDGKVTPVLDSLGEGVYRDLCLHWDARRLLFSFGNGSDAWDGKQSYHIYELELDAEGGPAGKPPRQVTFGPKNDCEPIYLPTGRIGFTSDRGEHFVMCGGDRHAANLFACNADGSGLRQISFNVFNDFNPSIMADGRILYDRWEYNERSVTSLHKAFTMRPDGTHVAPLYGNATIKPNVIMFPRQVPGSGKIMALLTAHHGQTHGPIGLIDPDRGVDGEGPLTVLTPAVPVSGEKVTDSFAGWFSDPVPLSETTYLCSFTPTVQPWLKATWSLYVGDRHGNIALVWRDQTISCAEPLPLLRRPRPAVPAEQGTPYEAASTVGPALAGTEARLLMVDVYEGLAGVPRGTVRFLRILEDVPRKGVHSGGVIRTAATSIYTVKRILGTVPVEADGSAHFVVPGDRNVYFEALDAEQREVQRMRSVVCLRPLEQRTCVGCHEPRTTAPPNRRGVAFARPADRPAPPPWGAERTLSFLRDVQPILDAHCVRCHTHDRAACRVILTDDLTEHFSVGYEELVPYLRTANSMRWDHPDDVYARPPYTYGSKVSPLCVLLDKGHHGVRLPPRDMQVLAAWVDANGVYYDRYECDHYGGRSLFSRGEVARVLADVYGRRCGTCHGQDAKAGQDTWWRSIRWREPGRSRALQAPLARSAGGWQRCGAAVFATKDDRDYQALNGALAALGEQLRQRPREDLMTLKGTPAWNGGADLPAPPPPAPATAATAVDGKSAVYLSDLKWVSATSGWSRTADKVPRRDLDAEDAPLRLGGRRYAKGIGTHAPSEIVYALDGGFARFTAVIGGAEKGGTVVFQVYGDGRLLHESGLLRGLGEVRKLDLDVKGVRRLRLVVTDGGDNYYADMANWADAVLHRSAAASQPAK